MSECAALVVMISTGVAVAQDRDARRTFRFDFGAGRVAPEYVQILPTTVYQKEIGYGLENSSTVRSVDVGGGDALLSDSVTSDASFSFLVDVPEGNYQVTVLLGGQPEETITTVKSEARRLMLEKVRTARGKVESRTFTVNVRYSEIASGETVRLKSRELDHRDWDRNLSLEFSGKRPSLCALEIEPLDDAITVYLAGDSTVTDQKLEPWTAWGQTLPRFFKPQRVVIANHAESGEALKSFIAERRLEKILSTIQRGDYLFVQFGHNDQKPGAAHVDPFTDYKEYLKLYIAEARKRGAIPVLVTPMHRLRFDSKGKIVNTHGDYPEAMRQTAREEGVALIDLFGLSQKFLEALGPKNAQKAFVDGSHTNEYGAYELARCIADAIRKSDLGLSKFVSDRLPSRNWRPPEISSERMAPRPSSTPEGS